MLSKVTKNYIIPIKKKLKHYMHSIKAILIFIIVFVSFSPCLEKRNSIHAIWKDNEEFDVLLVHSVFNVYFAHYEQRWLTFNDFGEV